MTTLARTEGTVGIRAGAQAFVSAFAQRVETGLLAGAAQRRNRYVVTRRGSDAVAFRAMDWLTAFNVGLNDVEITTASEGKVRYTIQYRRWAAYVLLFGVAFALVLGALPIFFDLRGYIERNAVSRMPGLSIDQNVTIFWVMVVFWGSAWPWIMIGLHKKPLRRLMESIIAEVDAGSMTSR